jgi:hypothetical protein
MNMYKPPRRAKFSYDRATTDLLLLCQSHEAALSGSPYKLHVLQVFNDDEFKNEVENLRELLETKYGKDVSFICTDTSSFFESCDFELVKRLAGKYAISIMDLYGYADGHFAAGMEYGKTNDDVEGIEFGLDGQVYYRISASTTMESIRLRRNDIEQAQKLMFGKAHSRKRGAENPELLYAIFKAKRQGMNFTQIFKQYQDGLVGNYKIKSTEQFASSDSLQRYFNKYLFIVPVT